MKDVILFCFLFGVPVFGANIVIPGANFRAFCISEYDNDLDGGINESEALAVLRMNCGGKRIHDITGIRYFSNLEYFNCQQNSIKFLPDGLSNLTKLLTLNCGNNDLIDLPQLSALVNLKELFCPYNQLTSLPDLSHYTNLTKLYCIGNQLTSLSGLSNLIQLRSLECSNNRLKTLPDLSNLTELGYLRCGSNQLTRLPDLSNLSYLMKNLDCNNNQLTSLPDLSSIHSVRWLDCSNNQLNTLPDLTKLKSLIKLDCSSNQLTSLPDFSGTRSLRELDCSNNQLTVLPDLTQLQYFHTLSCCYNLLNESSCDQLDGFGTDNYKQGSFLSLEGWPQENWLSAIVQQVIVLEPATKSKNNQGEHEMLTPFFLTYTLDCGQLQKGFNRSSITDIAP